MCELKTQGGTVIAKPSLSERVGGSCRGGGSELEDVGWRERMMHDRNKRGKCMGKKPTMQDRNVGRLRVKKWGLRRAAMATAVPAALRRKAC